MKSWYPYFIFEVKDKGILIGETLNTKSEARCWVPIGYCICWTTRECLSIEREWPTYATLEKAKEDATGTKGQPIKYPFTEHFEKDPAKKGFAEYHMAALPVLDRKESVYWCVATEGGAGYQVRWIKWDGKNDGITLRFRATRVEFERYLGGLYRLERVWRERNRIALLGAGVDFATSTVLSEHSDADTIRRRLKGIPKLTGYMLEAPESEMEYKALKDKLLSALEISSSGDVWDCTDVSYLSGDKIY
jgi:hypothetical protein